MPVRWLHSARATGPSPPSPVGMVMSVMPAESPLAEGRPMRSTGQMTSGRDQCVRQNKKKGGGQHGRRAARESKGEETPTRRGSCTKDLPDLALLVPPPEILHAELALLDQEVDAVVLLGKARNLAGAGELEERGARDAGEDLAIEWGGDEVGLCVPSKRTVVSSTPTTREEEEKEVSDALPSSESA